jgi:hypothetical protein
MKTVHAGNAMCADATTYRARPSERAEMAGDSSGPCDGAHRVQPDDDRGPRVERQLVSDVSAAKQLADERSFAQRQADEQTLSADIDGRDVVVVANDAEPAPELVHRNVGPALDEASELRRGAAWPEAIARRGLGRCRWHGLWCWHVSVPVELGTRLVGAQRTVASAVPAGVLVELAPPVDRQRPGRRIRRQVDGRDRGRSRVRLSTWIGRLEAGPARVCLAWLAGGSMRPVAVMSAAHAAATPGACADGMVTAAQVRRGRVDDMCTAVLADRFGPVVAR